MATTAQNPSTRAIEPDTRTPVRWLVCALLFAATAINYMDRSVLGLLAHTLHEALHWNEDSYSHVVMAFTLAYGAGYIVAGRLVDLLGTRRAYALCVFLWTLAAMAHSLVTSLAGFAVARLALGLAESGNFPAAIRAVSEWFAPEERALATGLFNAGSNAAALVAPFLVATLMQRFGSWRAAFVGVGALGLGWLVLWLLFPYQRLRPRALEAADRQDEPAPPAGVAFRTLLGQRATWGFVVAKAATDPVWWLYLFWLPKFLQQRFHLSVDGIGWPLASVYCISSVGAVVGGWASGALMRRGMQALPARKLVLAVCAACALALVLGTHLRSLGGVIALFGLLTAAHQAWAANLFAANTDVFPHRLLSTAAGISGAMGALGGACFQWFTGYVLQRTHGNYAPIFLLAALLYPCSFAAFHWLTRAGTPTFPHSGSAQETLA